MTSFFKRPPNSDSAFSNWMSSKAFNRWINFMGLDTFTEDNMLLKDSIALYACAEKCVPSENPIKSGSQNTTSFCSICSRQWVIRAIRDLCISEQIAEGSTFFRRVKSLRSPFSSMRYFFDPKSNASFVTSLTFIVILF